MKLLVITANVSGISSNTFVPQNVPNVDFVKLDDSNYTTRTKSMHPRLQGKIPKMLAWELYPDYDYYLWVDNTFSFKNADSVEWYLNQLENKDAAFYIHSTRKSIKDEVYHVSEGIKEGNNYLLDRYKNENVEEQVATYLKDPNYNDNILFSAGVFIYSANLVKNKENNVMKEWFYQNCIWSIEDQLSLPYVLQKHNINYNIINENIYKSLESK
jgi:hypothetical protein